MLPARLASQAQPAGRATHPPRRTPHLKPSPAQVQIAPKLSFTSFEVAYPCRGMSACQGQVYAVSNHQAAVVALHITRETSSDPRTFATHLVDCFEDLGSELANAASDVASHAIQTGPDAHLRGWTPLGEAQANEPSAIDTVKASHKRIAHARVIF